MTEEIFGPILPILTYSDLGKLIAKIKSLPKRIDERIALLSPGLEGGASWGIPSVVHPVNYRQAELRRDQIGGGQRGGCEQVGQRRLAPGIAARRHGVNPAQVHAPK
jgi:hypothetical protein